MSKKKTTPQPREGQRVRTRIKHLFTEVEKDDKVKDMTRKMREVELKTEQVKSVAATGKAEIKKLSAEVVDLRNQLDDGGEFREVDAVVVMDRKKGTKTFYRFAPDQPGHDEKLRVETMSESDYQDLGLDVSPAMNVTLSEPEGKEQPESANSGNENPTDPD